MFQGERPPAETVPSTIGGQAEAIARVWRRFASLGNDQASVTDDDLLATADRRESMMETAPNMEMSHEELLEAFANRRNK